MLGKPYSPQCMVGLISHGLPSYFTVERTFDLCGIKTNTRRSPLLGINLYHAEEEDEAAGKAGVTSRTRMRTNYKR